MLLTQTTQADYEELCRLGHLRAQRFTQTRSADSTRWIEGAVTAFAWRMVRNRTALARQPSKSLVKWSRKSLDTQEYDAIICDQIQDGVVEIEPGISKNKEFYLLHKIPETTKMSIVYDALVRANSKAPLLNECLYPGPSLQNKLWDILVQQTAYPVIMSGDIRKSFIQIRIWEWERDALRFHWCKDEHYAKHCHSQGHY